MDKDILNKIQVISTSLDSRSNYGSDSFEIHDLYKPSLYSTVKD